MNRTGKIFIVFGVLAVFAAIVIAGVFFKAKNIMMPPMSPAKSMKFESWKTEILDISPDYQMVTAYSEETKNRARSVYDSYFVSICQGKGYTPDELCKKYQELSPQFDQESVRQEMEDYVTMLEPVSMRMKVLMKRPDYSLDVLSMIEVDQRTWKTPYFFFDLYIPSFWGDMLYINYIKMSKAIRASDMDAFLDPLIQAHRLLHVKPQSIAFGKEHVFTHYIYIMNDTWITMEHFDQQQLVRLKDEVKVTKQFMQALCETSDFPSSVNRALFMNRFGVTADLSEKTGLEAFFQLKEQMREYMKLKMKTAKLTPSEKQQLELFSDGGFTAETMVSHSNFISDHLGFTDSMLLSFIGGEREFPHEIDDLKQYVLVYIDLMDLCIAQREYELDYHKALENPSELVPEYLVKISLDRYAVSGESYLFNGERFYSVGPDQKDEKCGYYLVYQNIMKKGDITTDQAPKGDVFLSNFWLEIKGTNERDKKLLAEFPRFGEDLNIDAEEKEEYLEAGADE